MSRTRLIRRTSESLAQDMTASSGCTRRAVRTVAGFNDKQPEHRIADWLCRHACSFVLFDTKPRATVIGFEREDDAEALRREYIR
jgi:hypothetical protein